MPPKKTKESKRGGGGGSSTDVESQQQQLYLRQSLQQEKSQLEQRLQKREYDSQSLREAAERSSKETAEFIGYFQKQLEQKDEYINELRDKIRHIEYESTSELKKLKRAYDDQQVKDRKYYEDTIETLRRDYKSAKEELGRLQEFKLKKAEYDASVEELREELEQERKARHQDLAQMERKFLVEKRTIVQEHEKEYAQLKKKAKKEAQNQLDTGTKRVLFDNKRMSEELAFHQEQTQLLTKEKERLQQKNKELAREVSILQEKEQEYAKQGQRKHKLIDELKERVRYLEGQLEQREHHYEDHAKASERYTQSKFESLKEELKDTQMTLQRKDEELSKIRRLANTILKQRSDVEQFLLEAIHDVRKEIAARKAQAGMVRTSTSYYDDAKRESIKSQLPSIRKAVVASRRGLHDSSKQESETSAAARRIAETGSLEIHVGESGGAGAPDNRLESLVAGADAHKIDIKQLTPVEKERVLRILFSKINAHIQQEHQAQRTSPQSMATENKQRDRSFEAGAPFGLSVPFPKELEQSANYRLPSEEESNLYRQQHQQYRQSHPERGEDSGQKLLSALHQHSDSQLQAERQQRGDARDDYTRQQSYSAEHALPDLT